MDNFTRNAYVKSKRKLKIKEAISLLEDINENSFKQKLMRGWLLKNITAVKITFFFISLPLLLLGVLISNQWVMGAYIGTIFLISIIFFSLSYGYKKDKEFEIKSKIYKRIRVIEGDLKLSFIASIFLPENESRLKLEADKVNKSYYDLDLDEYQDYYSRLRRYYLSNMGNLDEEIKKREKKEQLVVYSISADDYVRSLYITDAHKDWYYRERVSNKMVPDVFVIPDICKARIDAKRNKAHL